MSASTVLEVVRMGSSALGAVFAVLALFAAVNETKRINQRDAATREEMFRQESDQVGARGTKIRLIAFLAIQLGMLFVAKQAYDTTDNPLIPISPLALSSNMNQIAVTIIVMILTIWDGRDLSSRLKIERMAAFVPQKRAGRSTKKRETVELED